MEDPFAFWQFDINEDDDDDDEAYQPDDNSNDDEDDDNVDAPNENLQNKPTFDLNQVILRFNMPHTLVPNQLFIASLPKKEDIPNSPFTVEQWDLLRHQCRIHFALLCRSISFTAYCASSDAIVTGLLALLHSYNIIFKSSIETTANLNNLFGETLFVPVLGDPRYSLISRTDFIIDTFLRGKNVDDLMESPFFTEIFKAFPTKGIDKPLYLACHSPWTKEEDELLEVAHKRFESPIDIQRFVMPGRSLQMITQHLKGEWKQPEEIQDNVNTRRQEPETETTTTTEDEQHAASDQTEEDEDDDQPFIINENMRFADGTLPEDPSKNLLLPRFP